MEILWIFVLKEVVGKLLSLAGVKGEIQIFKKYSIKGWLSLYKCYSTT